MVRDFLDLCGIKIYYYYYYFFIFAVQEIVDDETEEEEDADEDEITETELALNEIIRFLTELEARGLMSKKHVGLLEELLFNNR